MKSILVILLVVVMAFSLVACGSGDKKEPEAAPTPSEKAMGETLTKIKERGTLIMGVNATYPPFEFHKNVDGKDTLVGFDIELGKAIADELGVELEIKDMSFDGLLPALKAGKVDILPGLAETAERAENAAFTIPYHRSKQVVIIRKSDEDKFPADTDLSDKTIGILKGAVQEISMPKYYPKAKLHILGKIPDLILALKNGKIDGVLLDNPVAILYEKANPDLMVSKVGYELSKEEDPGSSVLVRKDNNEDLIEIINKVLDRVMKDGTLWQWELDAIDLMDAPEGN